MGLGTAATGWLDPEVCGDLDYEAADSKAGISRREAMTPYRQVCSSMRSSVDRSATSYVADSLRKLPPAVGPQTYDVRRYLQAPHTKPHATHMSSQMISNTPRMDRRIYPTMRCVGLWSSLCPSLHL